MEPSELSMPETHLFAANVLVLVKVLGAVANILDRCVGARAKRGVGGTASKVGGGILSSSEVLSPMHMYREHASSASRLNVRESAFKTM